MEAYNWLSFMHINPLDLPPHPDQTTFNKYGIDFFALDVSRFLSVKPK